MGVRNILTCKRAIRRLPFDFCRGRGRLPAKLRWPSPMRPMPRKPDEARGGANTSSALGTDHSIASSPAFVRYAVACVESWVPLAQGRVPMRGRGRGVGGCRKGAGAEVGRVPRIIDWTAALRAISWLGAVPDGTASHSMSSGDASERVVPDERASLMAGSVSGILASRIGCARCTLSFSREAWEVRPAWLALV